MLFRFREKDSREGITRKTLKQLAQALDVSETAAIHKALVEYARAHVPQYPRDDGPLSATQLRKISGIVRKKHGNANITVSLLDEPVRKVGTRASKRVSAARGR